MRGAILGAENSDDVGFPASGRSGVSVTPIQLDLAGNPKVREAFIDAGVNSGAITNRAEAERLFSIRYDDARMGPGSPGEAQFKQDRRDAIALAGKAMQKPEVREVTDRAVERHLDKVAEATDRVCGRAAPQAQAFCNSTQGRLEIAAYVHQGNPDDTKKLETYIRGGTVTLGDGEGGQRRSVRIEGNLDAEQFRNGYQGSTLWGQTNRKGLDSRHDRIDRFLRQQGIDDGSRARINPGQRSEAAPDAQAPAQAQASLGDEGGREQSANVGASYVQRTPHRTEWNPDLAKLDEAVASVGAQDLAPWARNLLGRDVMANGPDAAVKGFQRTINAATKPLSFDYHWGLGGRTGRIDVDGDLGPQTRAGLGRAIDKQGEDGFKKLYAIDQFGRYVQRVGRGRARLDDLEDTLAGTLGQAVPDAPERAQETLNMFAEDREEPGSPLKIDGWVGPKTTEAFGTLLNKTSPDRMMERFAGKDFWDDEGLI
jgi:hypothetical protein